MANIEDYQLFHEIVNYQEIMPKITVFFENLRISSKNNTAASVIDTLNKMLLENEPLRLNIKDNAQKEDIRVDLLSWYELFNCIYTIKWRMAERSGESVKQPIFCTFNRTFENPAFYPECWFESAQEKKSVRRLIASPSELLFAFERYMYAGGGAACWAAVDITINKYNFRCVCEPAGKLINYEDPCGKIASLVLAAHRIVTGDLGLYLSESQEVNLRYAGVKTGDPSLLKYFHFNRHTRLSYIRERELDKDSDKTKPFPGFTFQWEAAATMTEFILQTKGARATKTTCSRVSIGTIIQCLSKLRVENALQKNGKAIFMLDKGIELLDSENFAAMSAEEVMAEIKWDKKIIPADYYLKKYNLRSAEEFWEFAGKVFEAFVEQFNDKYHTLSSSAKAPANGPVSVKEDCVFLFHALEWGKIDELRGRFSGARLREALKILMVNGDLEFNCRQLWSILQKNYDRDLLQFFSPNKGRKIPLSLPCAWLTTDIASKNASAELNSWARDILSCSTKNKDSEIVLNFSAVDFSAIQEASDKTWEIYFSPQYESAVRSRYIISLLRAKEIIENENNDRYIGIKLIAGAARKELLRYINEELFTLTGGIEINLAREQEEFAKQGIYCFADFRPTWQRGIVILDIIARLVVTAAKNEIFAAIWNDVDERVRFITHILSATHSNLVHPFPYHIGLQGDTVLRISRGTDQGDHLTRLANHEYENNAERYCFMISLVKYLNLEKDPEKILQAIIDNSTLAAFAAPDQLDHLKVTGKK